MASTIIRDQRVYVGSTQITSALNSVALTTGVDILDDTSLGQSSRTRKGGLRFSDVQIDGFFGAGANGPDSVLFAAIGEELPVCITPDAAAETETVFFMSADGVDYKNQGNVGDFLKFSLSAQSSGHLYRGVVANNSARTATGNSAAQLLGAVSSVQSVACAVYCTAVTGTAPSMTLKIQSDDNAGFTTPTDRATFTALTAAGSQMIVAPGPVTDTYWRAQWTITGTTPSFNFLAVMAIQ